MKFTVNTSLQVLKAAFFALATTFSVTAQISPRVNPTAAARPESTPFEVSTTYSFSSGGDAEYASRQNGEVEISQWRATGLYRVALTPVWTVGLGANLEQFTIDYEGALPVPEELNTVSALLESRWQFREDWTFTAIVEPGVFSDDEASSSDGFSVPGVLLVSHRWSDTLTLSGGVRVSPLSKYSVLPAIGVRWQASDAWTLTLGAPRTEAAYRLSPETTVFASAGFVGGTYAVSLENVAPQPGVPNLRDTELDFSEVRLGAGVQHRLSATFTLRAEAGWAVAREFDYDDRDFTVDVDDAFYGAVTLSARF